MNICLATSTFPSSPTDTAHAAFLLEVIEVLRRAGHHISVLTQQRESRPTPPLKGLEVVWFPWRHRVGRLAELSFSSPDALLSAASLIVQGTRQVRAARRERHVDVFVCCWMIPSGFYLYLNQVLGRSRTPYVIWALGSDVNKYKSNRLMRAALTQIAHRAGHVYADGFKLCDDITAVTGHECEFLPTFRALGAPSAKERPREGGGVRRFMYVGRHAKVKGVDVLIDALIALKNLGDPPYQFNIVGDGDMTAELRRKIESANLTGKVHFCGRLSDGELAAQYALVDCVVIPSRSESIPVVMSEAMQSGVPLIVTDVGDMGDLARRYALGDVVPPGDPKALAESIRRFIAAPWQLDHARAAELLGVLAFEAAAPKLLQRLEALVNDSRRDHQGRSQ
jgi:glycosyltransferase involved in cell wall biosynthesis